MLGVLLEVAMSPLLSIFPITSSRDAEKHQQVSLQWGEKKSSQNWVQTEISLWHSVLWLAAAVQEQTGDICSTAHLLAAESPNRGQFTAPSQWTRAGLCLRAHHKLISSSLALVDLILTSWKSQEYSNNEGLPHSQKPGLDSVYLKHPRSSMNTSCMVMCWLRSDFLLGCSHFYRSLQHSQVFMCPWTVQSGHFTGVYLRRKAEFEVFRPKTAVHSRVGAWACCCLSWLVWCCFWMWLVSHSSENWPSYTKKNIIVSWSKHGTNWNQRLWFHLWVALQWRQQISYENDEGKNEEKERHISNYPSKISTQVCCSWQSCTWRKSCMSFW